MRSIAGGIDGLEAVFDDASLVADAGLLLAGTVMVRLGLEALIDDTVRLEGRGAGRKALSLVASMLVGGCCIDATGRLRSGASQGRPPRPRPPPATAHRRRHRSQPPPRHAGPPRQPQRPPQAPPARPLALANTFTRALQHTRNLPLLI